MFLDEMRAQMSTIAPGGSREPEPIIPALAPFYAWSSDFSYFLVRVAAGGTLLAHGVIKMTTSTIAGFAAGSLARRGIEPALPLAYVVWFMETIGAICIMVGLFTRFFAAAAVIEFIVIISVAHWSYGFLWSRPGGGWEYPLLWCLIFVAIMLRGGGPYSLDRKIGREL
jgi:putative oxidoreductase